MARKMLIDTSHDEEVRVAVVEGNRLVDYETETSTKRQLKGNIYLAKVIRIEPSLQAAFVDFGGNRHGFLPFAEIHPDYYRIPVSDRNALEESLKEAEKESAKEEEINIHDVLQESAIAPETEKELVIDEVDLSDDEVGIVQRARTYQYKIQEVIKRRQIMLVQVVKEERGNKGAALTTYLSLPGRYCVFMPNAGHRSGGISRKISDAQDRKRLKEVLSELNIPSGVSLIVRTAGQERNKLEIRRDFEYLTRLWSDIREATLKSTAPELVYAEGDLIKRSIRDGYNKDIGEIIVEGDEGYKLAKTFMKTLIPSHAKRVKAYKDPNLPLFQKHQVEAQIDMMMQPITMLPSGGSIVINQTEALVAIDVNSGKSTRERHIDETAVKTNLEAADEIARQIRLRDLAGLIVIDFIDMSDQKHIQNVEKRVKEAVKNDRARTQIGKISQFGLLELSRQRLRPSLMETNTSVCTHCRGTGVVRSIESMALHVLRAIEAEGILGRSSEIIVTVPGGVDLYLLNQKRMALHNIERRFEMFVMVQRDDHLVAPDFRIECLKERVKPLTSPIPATILDTPTLVEEPEEIEDEEIEEELEEEKTASEVTPQRDTRQRRRHFTQRRRGTERYDNREKSPNNHESSDQKQSPQEEVAEKAPEPSPSADENQPQGEKSDKGRRRRRGRRGGNRRNRENGEASQNESSDPAPAAAQVSFVPPSEALSKPDKSEKSESSAPKRQRRGWLKRLFEA